MNNQQLIDELEQLDNDKYISVAETEKQKKQSKKEIQDAQKEEKRQMQLDLQKQKIQNNEEKREEKKIKDAEQYSEIQGVSRLTKLNTINKYKLLFPELKDFTFKKNASSEELSIIITEMQTIVELSSIDDFLVNSIYDTLLMLEPYTVPTRCNITGISAMLKLNPNFTSILKKLILKYDLSTSTSPEIQLIIIITTSLYMTIQKNNSKIEINNYLNQKI